MNASRGRIPTNGCSSLVESETIDAIVELDGVLIGKLTVVTMARLAVRVIKAGGVDIESGNDIRWSELYGVHVSQHESTKIDS